MPQELLRLQQMLSVGSGWAQATLLAGLLLILVFRPERIRKPNLFSLACWCFALSVLAPPLLNLLFMVLGGVPFAGMGGYGNLGGSLLVTFVLMSCEPVLFGVSVLLVFLSLMPGPPPAIQPPRHPLE